jgi:hypothetical protein
MLRSMDRPLLRLNPQAVEWRAVEGEVVALDLNRSTYLGVNPSGSVLWEEIARGATRDQLVQRLVDTFEIGEEAARADVDAFVEDLLRRGLAAEAE